MIPMHLRLHWPFIRNNFICTSNISQISASLIFLLTRKTAQFIIVQIITLDIYKCITKSNLQEARAEMFLFDIFVVVVVALGLSFLLIFCLSYLYPNKFVFRKQRLRNEGGLVWTVFADHSITLYVTEGIVSGWF